jgi:hypothetical protein
MRLKMSKKRTEEKEKLTQGLRIIAQIIAREIAKKNSDREGELKYERN